MHHFRYAPLVLLAVLLVACSGTTTENEPGEAETAAIDPQVLALGPGDLPNGFSAADLQETTPGEAPPGCDVFGELQLENERGVSYEADDGFRVVEMRVAAGTETDRIVGGLADAGSCPDADYTDDEGTTVTGSFDTVDVPAGSAASFSGTAAGVPFVAQFAGFRAGGHTVTMTVFGVGDLPDGVDLAELVQLTLDRANGDEPPAANAPDLQQPLAASATADPGGTEDPQSTGSAPPAEEGSREQPLAIGETALVGDWEVTVDEIQLSAADAITAANEFNEAPTNGNYGLVTLTATYVGDDEGDAGFELAVALSGADRRQHADTDCRAVEPNPMLEQPTVESGGTVTGQFCVDYPDEALGPDAVLFVEATLSFDETRRFWALPS